MSNLIKFEDRIIMQMKSQISGGHHPVTEGYLCFLFDDLLSTGNIIVPKSARTTLYNTVKTQFTIDSDAVDFWSPPDAGFETRLRDAFVAKLNDDDIPPSSGRRVQRTFQVLLWTMINREYLHINSLQRKDLWDKIKNQLEL